MADPNTPAMTGDEARHARFTDCTAYLSEECAERRLAFRKVAQKSKYGGLVINVAAQNAETGEFYWPRFRLDEVALPFNLSKWDSLSIPAGPETPLGAFVERFERAAERRVREQAAEWCPGVPAEAIEFRNSLRDSPAGPVLDVKQGSFAPEWKRDGMPTEKLTELARHRVRLEVSIEGLYIKAGAVTTRWRLLSCDDLGPAAAKFDNSEYAFVDLDAN